MQVAKGNLINPVRNPPLRIREHEHGGGVANLAEITISGRYPEQGLVRNQVCTMLVYVLDGQLTLHCAGRQELLDRGDSARIDCSEEYCWTGAGTILAFSTPEWSPDQQEEVAEAGNEVRA